MLFTEFWKDIKDHLEMDNLHLGDLSEDMVDKVKANANVLYKNGDSVYDAYDLIYDMVSEGF